MGVGIVGRALGLACALLALLSVEHALAAQPTSAASVAKEKFPELFAPVPTAALAVGPKAKIDYLSDWKARVTVDGRTSMVESTMPLRDPKGRPVDLALEDRGDVFGPRNPAVPVTMSEELTGGVRVGSIGLRFAKADPRTSGKIIEQQVFYADAFADTDVLVTPVGAGAIETFIQMRTPDSSREYSLDLELPSGASLRREPANGKTPDWLIIVHGNKTLATLSPVAAIDADKRPVSAHYEVHGRSVTIVVEPDPNATYPILVDPVLDWNFGSDAGNANGFVIDGYGWYRSSLGVPLSYFSFVPNADNSSAAGASCPRSSGGNVSPALCVGTFFGAAYGAGGLGEWLWRPPAGLQTAPTNPDGTPNDSYVYRLDMRSAFYDAFSTAFNQYFYAGLWSPRSNNWIGGNHRANAPDADIANPVQFFDSESSFYRTYCIVPTRPPAIGCTDVLPEQYNDGFRGPQYVDGTYARWGIGGSGSAITGVATMQGHAIFQSDRSAPTSTYTNAFDTSKWFDTTTLQTTVNGYDKGMGMWEVGLVIPWAAGGGGIFNPREPSPSAELNPMCNGTRHDRCPQSFGHTFGYSTGSMPEGVNAVGAGAKDVLGKIGTSSFNVKVDQSKPTIAEVSGELWNARDQATDHRLEGLYNDGYTLRVRATDAHSGIKNIEVYVDEVSQQTRGGFSSSGALDWTLDPDDYNDGPHTIKIVARDALDGEAGVPDRHKDVRTFDVTVDRRGDIYRATQTLNDPNAPDGSQLLTEANKFNTPLARVVEPDATTTRDIVQCPRNPSGCGEVRQVSPASANPDGRAIVTVYQGSSPTDPALDSVTDLVSLYQEDSASGVQPTTGPLIDAMEPFQQAPPAHGTTYTRYSFSGPADTSTTTDGPSGEQVTSETTTVTTTRWYDTATKMPLKEVVASPDAIESVRYWLYEKQRLTATEVPADYFHVSDPSALEQRKEVSYYGAASPGSVSDPDSGSTYRGYSFGPVVTIAGLVYCATNNIRETLGEVIDDRIPRPGVGPLTADPIAAITTRVLATYRRVADAASCLLGQAEGDPDLVIRTTPRTSQLANAWRTAYQAAGWLIQTNVLDPDFLRAGLQPILLQPLLNYAWVVPIDSTDQGLFYDIGDLSIVVTGAFGKLDAQQIIGSLQVLS